MINELKEKNKNLENNNKELKIKLDLENSLKNLYSKRINEFNPNTKPVVAIPNVDDIPNDIPICLNSFILFEYKFFKLFSKSNLIFNSDII